MPLAILAGLCDVIPVIGIIIATLPAVLLAVTVSPATAAVVFALYLGYHVVESYVIVPRIYGQRLRLSTLAVLLALLAGTTLQGLIGAVLVLPLVAAYPIIERIWLASYLGPRSIKDHSALAKRRASARGGGRDRAAGREAPVGGADPTWRPARGGLKVFRARLRFSESERRPPRR